VESQDLETQSEATTSTEIGFVRRAQTGDSEAFAELVKMYQRRAVSVAYRLVGSIEDASDVSQDAFIRAYRYLDQLEDPSRFGPWLLRVVSNLALNFRRARRGKQAASLDDGLPVHEQARQPATGLRIQGEGRPSDGQSDELRAAISQAMERLPDKQRLALVLFSVEGMPQREVAEILECSVELVKWNVFQARKKLKETLKEYL